jgi:hypothetical protein
MDCTILKPVRKTCGFARRKFRQTVAGVFAGEN